MRRATLCLLLLLHGPGCVQTPDLERDYDRSGGDDCTACVDEPGDPDDPGSDSDDVGPACEPACDPGWTCSASTCIRVIAEGQADPIAVAVDETYVYWANAGSFDVLGNFKSDGSIMKAPLDGGQAVPLAVDQGLIWWAAIDDSFVYWVALSWGGQEADILRVSKAGGSPELLASFANFNLARLDADHLYACGTWDAVDGLFLVPKDGGTDPQWIASCGRDLVVGEDALYGYWWDTYKFYSMPKDGSADWTPTGAQSIDMNVLFGAIDGSFYYWEQRDAWRIFKGPAEGTPLVVALEDNFLGYRIPAVEADALYWLAISQGAGDRGLFVATTTPNLSQPAGTLSASHVLSWRTTLAIAPERLYVVSSSDYGATDGIVFAIQKPVYVPPE